MHRNHEMRKFYVRINRRRKSIEFDKPHGIDNSTYSNISPCRIINIVKVLQIENKRNTTTKHLSRMKIKLIKIELKLQHAVLEEEIDDFTNNNNFNNSYNNYSDSIKMYHPNSSIGNNTSSLIIVTTATTTTTSTTNNAVTNIAAAAVAAAATSQLLLRDKNDTSLYDTVAAGDMNLTVTPAFAQILLPPTLSTTLAFASSNSSSGGGGGNGATGFDTAANDEPEPLNSFYFYQTEQLIVLCFLFTVIVLGNSAVLITLFLNKNRKSRMNFFIKQLAIADLCVGLLNVLTDIIWRITVSWRAGNFACKLIRFLQASVTYASTYVLVALSIDRYDAITHPMNFSGSWKRARRLVAAAWLLSAIFSTPMLFLYEESVIEGQTQCWIDLGEPWRWQIYMSLVSTVLFVVPALIISACYAIIVRTIWAKGAIYLGPPEHRSRGICNTTTGNGYASGVIDRDRRASSRGIIPRAKVKTVKMTIVIVIVFVLCWSPYIVFDLLQVFQKIPKTQTNLAIATMIQSLAPLNSAANPIIYCLFSTQVCRALKRIPPFRWFVTLWCCWGCKSQHDHRSSQTTIRCNANGQRMNNSNDSMRTLTTSLTVSRRSASYMRPARVVIVERPKTILAMSEV